DMVTRIATALRFQPLFFYGEAVDLIPPEAVSFRATSSMSSATRNVGLGVGDIVASVIEADLQSRFNLPKVDVPDLSNHDPEDAAALLRVRWKLGLEPIQNMVHLLESKGVSVYWLAHDSPSLDAVSWWREKKPFVLLNSHKQAGDRARFDAAHELAHLVLHRRAGTLWGRDVEKEADKFAAAFLLPADQFRKECPDQLNFHHLYQLKLRWKVSVSAMVMRAYDLGIFSESQRRQAFQRMNATGTLIQEKAAFQREQSKLHPMVFEALAKKNISPADYALQLHLDVDDIHEFMPTSKLYMPTLTDRKIINFTQWRRANVG
ncbi:MAG TPA: ImmA/IrrE family metallo-endopeptidase, partial [Caldilineaceae bacterium]|nr:ImmA/IrrE family metallo-endopeptidase [Caldilineaceae bacterium]